MSDENSLTFVGGKAVEQHTQLDSNVEPEVREEAKAAVREAIQRAAQESKDSSEKASKQDPYKPAGAKTDKDPEESGKSPVSKKPAKASNEAPERGPDGKFLPRDGKGPQDSEVDEPDGDDKTSLKNLFKHREKVATEKKTVHTQLDQERQKIADETRRLQETWAQIQQEQQRLDRERQKYERLRKDPAAAIRDVGWEPEQFIIDLARDGTPEGQMARQQRELQQQIREMQEWKQEQARQAQEAQQRYQWEQQVQYRQHIEKTFLDDALHEDNRPHTAAFYKGREHALMAYADLIAAQYRDLSGGKEASLKEVADYIEEELADRAEAWYVKKSGTGKDAVSQAKPGKGSKGKSLTPEAASDRRSLGRNSLKELDDDERVAAARDAVAAALEKD